MGEYQGPIDIMAAGSNPTPQGGLPEQGSEEQSDLKMVLNLITEGKKARGKWDKKEEWDKLIDFHLGDQWKYYGSVAANKPKPVLNICHSTVQTVVSILTDAEPGFSIQGFEPTDFEFGEKLGLIRQAWWERVGAQQRINDAILAACIYPFSCIKVVWNKELEDGIGDVEFELVAGEDILVPEGALDFDKRCPWVIQTSRKRIGWLKKMFPKQAERLTSGTGSMTGTESVGTNQSNNVNIITPTDKHGTSPGGSNQAMDDKTVQVAECWMEDEAIEQYEQEYEEDGVKKTKTEYRKKWPKGKIVTICTDYNLHLQTVANDYKDGKKPYVKFIDMVIPGKFHGEGEIQPLIDVQMELNGVEANIYDHFKHTKNAPWKVEKGSGVDVNNITNEHGIVLEYNQGSQPPARDFPPAVPPYVVELRNFILQFVDTVTGVHEVTQGRKPAGVTAAEAIETLQEAAQTRIRLKERNNKNSLTQLAYLWVSRVMQYYREPRFAKITNKYGGQPKYFEYTMKDVKGDQGQDLIQMSTREHVLNQETGKFEAGNDGNFQPTAPSKGVFDIKVLSGTSLPYDKSERKATAFKLFEAGVIDDEALLTDLGYTKKEEVLQRKREMAAQQPPPGGPGAPPPPKGV